MALTSTPSEQLITTHILPNYLARSLTPSVLPVPAGPAGLPKNFLFKAVVKVIFNLSINGVTTKRPQRP